MVRKYREDDVLRNSTKFATWLFSSQPCEQTFRATRAVTSTFSTIVNFSLQDIINRINKIETINCAINDLSGKFIFPREIKNSKLGRFKVTKNDLIEDDKIEEIYMGALQEAIKNWESVVIRTND